LRVRLWDVATGVERLRLEHLDPVVSLGFSPDGRLLLTAGVRVRLWEVGTGREIRSFRGGPNLTGAALAPGGRTLATVGDRQPAVLWDAATGAEVRRIGSPAEGGNWARSRWATRGA
jgi:WD40 repeat protein